MTEEKDAKKQKILDNAMWIYWLIVMAAIGFACGVLYVTAPIHDEDIPVAVPGEAQHAERQAHLCIIIGDPASSESPPSASQGES